MDGIIKPKALAQRIKELGMKSYAVTEHGNMTGFIEHYKAAQEEGLNLLAASEVYITSNPDNAEEKVRDNNHLVLIAKNNEGLKELYRLISEANLSNFYYKPRIFIEKLKDVKNLIALSACLGSPISQALKWDKENKTLDTTDEAINLIKYFQSCFPNSFYLELQDHRDSWEQIKYNEWLLDFGKKAGVPFVITTDAHYLNKEDFTTHQFVMAQQFKKTIHEYSNQEEMIYGSDHYIQSYEEIKNSAGYLNCSEAVGNTEEIAYQCRVEVQLNKPQMPSFPYKEAQDYTDFLQWKKEKGECSVRS